MNTERISPLSILGPQHTSVYIFDITVKMATNDLQLIRKVFEHHTNLPLLHAAFILKCACACFYVYMLLVFL